ncbi:cysteine hydrolase family protein [Streptomyces litchfieldiae]|uniref:Isochorismatase family protein n=1 Tax=Streptomyces litchfieldiae TaxID=3075543 RepID=A0ABU2MRF2_9ACTN|nr:isochorismatase family protein [Streptomyces sp. DSM 44938]MDT0344209.1 isochorismatase family protein [Streptomyces sp. DSM 44938]
MATVLLLLDEQKNAPLPPDPLPGAAAVTAAIDGLVRRARSAGALVVHVRDAGAGAPGVPGREPATEAADGEHVVDRTGPDAFAGTGLAALLPVGAEVVVAGTRSEIGVRATALTALDRGHRVVLARGAHATHAPGVPREVEAELRAAGALVVDPQSVEFGPAGDGSRR